MSLPRLNFNLAVLENASQGILFLSNQQNKYYFSHEDDTFIYPNHKLCIICLLLSNNILGKKKEIQGTYFIFFK